MEQHQLKHSTEQVINKKQESMMANDNDNFLAKWSDKRMEEEEGLRTVECLRGRLVAERAASKAANDESEQISKKISELEKQLKLETKSRNKAEKRLKLLMEKLESLSISADESSSFSEISEILSVSSLRSQHQMDMQKPKFSKIYKCPLHEDHFPHLGSSDEAISGNCKENDSSEDDSKKMGIC